MDPNNWLDFIKRAIHSEEVLAFFLLGLGIGGYLGLVIGRFFGKLTTSAGIYGGNAGGKGDDPPPTPQPGRATIAPDWKGQLDQLRRELPKVLRTATFNESNLLVLKKDNVLVYIVRPGRGLGHRVLMPYGGTQHKELTELEDVSPDFLGTI